ncbi:MAG TPA: PKD-like domain-containing protein, partial [Ferruginibacter sp.]|nr:PKD-like domain-containing protein [Ferruginibacter sp.]
MINASGAGTLEYSVDGVSYQASSTFSGLAQGVYYVSARYTGNPNCALAYSANPVVIRSAQSRAETVIAGASPFQDSLWTVRLTNLNDIRTRIHPTLSGFSITGNNGLAQDPFTGQNYILMKVSGLSGRRLGKIDIATGVCTQVGNLGDNFSSITFRYDGQMFGNTGNGASIPETMWYIDKSNAAKAVATPLGAGADGEIICYNPDDSKIYHWSGNGTVVYENILGDYPFTTTNIPISGTPNGETFGAWYKGSNVFLTSNIGASYNNFTTTGTVTGPFGSNPDDLRGLVSRTCVTSITPACPAAICNGNSILLTANGGTGNYQWYNNGAAIGGATSATYSATTAGVYNCIFTDGCNVTDSVQVGVTVSLTSTDATATPSSQNSCSGSPITTIVLTSSTSPITFNWTRDNNATVTGIASSGSGNISGTLTNTTTNPVTVTFTITPVSGTCSGTPITATVQVYPTATVNQPSNQTVCNGAATATVNFTGNAANYYWTNADPSIGLAASGTGNINSFNAVNTSITPVTATITVTPNYGGGGGGGGGPQPEVLYYKFDGAGTTVPNLASAPPVGTAIADLMGALTQGGSAICNGTVIGSGNASTTDYVNTHWAPNLGNSSWTISFKSENITPSSTLFYIFGDANTNSFRCFTNGVAGANNWILRGPVTDISIPGGATVAPHTNTFVYDAAAGQTRAYLDGVLVNTVSQGAVNLT